MNISDLNVYLNQHGVPSNTVIYVRDRYGALKDIDLDFHYLGPEGNCLIIQEKV